MNKLKLLKIGTYVVSASMFGIRAYIADKENNNLIMKLLNNINENLSKR